METLCTRRARLTLSEYSLCLIDDLVDELYDQFGIDPIALDVAAKTSTGARDIEIEIRHPDRTSVLEGTRVEWLVPFDGDAALFDLRPSRGTLNPPRFGIRGPDIVLAYEAPVPIDGQQVKQSLEKLLETIEFYVASQRSQIRQWSDELRRELRTWIARRRDKVLQDRDLEAFLDVPIVGRSNPVRAFAVDPPSRPRPPPIATRPATEPFAPEPAISDEGYAAILTTIASVTVAVNRLPQTFVGSEVT